MNTPNPAGYAGTDPLGGGCLGSPYFASSEKIVGRCFADGEGFHIEGKIETGGHWAVMVYHNGKIIHKASDEP